ncbi:DUF2243 domain-containing protein [Peribacillus deserti]|uniref:DUF2243 domain-containing protein n=1 Tax=Peribacillus deserti TaxID=673318 RepID=A0A2N5LZV1_9BACI|nr:DUF2243 domain-containing protein [Peribacillus deserti]PLT27621.1 hypothetical protein CUU66_22845 [Peribacillus deserti]
MRIIGAITGFFLADLLFHLIDAFAVGMKAETPAGRIGAVFFGVLILMVLMWLFYRYFSKAFFNGFTVATGLFLSFDIVVFHWIFQLHRITNGPEANWIEPLFVIVGIVMVFAGIKQERSLAKQENNHKITM